MIQTDISIIGAGPAGLFAVFEAGLLKLRTHLIDYLPKPGGQLSEVYPKKPIYDIPGYPSILAQELVDNLLKQNEPFKPGYSLGQRVESLEKRGDRDFVLTTDKGEQINSKAVIIAGGLGCFEPRKPEVPELNRFEGGKGISYMVLDPEKYRNKKLVVAGGGDSALDWTIHLSEVASEVTLVHRSESFRGAPDSVNKVLQLSQAGKVNLLLNSNLAKVDGNGVLKEVIVQGKNADDSRVLEADELILLFGLSPKLGPIEKWGLNIEKNAIEVNPIHYSTSIEGVWAIGDINTYHNKLKLILCGFHEASIASHSIYKYINPGVKYTMKYTTVNGVNAF
jgi:thioredoxin reductase (NADPH)